MPVCDGLLYPPPLLRSCPQGHGGKDSPAVLRAPPSVGLRPPNTAGSILKSKNLETIQKAADVIGVPFEFLIGYVEEPDLDAFPMGLCYDCGFRALTVALALGLPGDYLPLGGPGGTDQQESVAGLSGHSLTAKGGNEGCWSGCLGRSTAENQTDRRASTAFLIDLGIGTTAETGYHRPGTSASA